MLQADGLQTLTETIMTDLVSSVIGHACLRVAKRAQKSIREMSTKAKPLTNSELVGVLLAPTSVQDVSLAKLLSLSQGVMTAAELRQGVSSNAVQAVTQQLVCAQLLGSTEEVFDDIEAAFIIALRTSMPGSASDPGISGVARELFQVLHDNVQRALTPAEGMKDREITSDIFAQITLVKASVDSIKNSLKSLAVRETLERNKKSVEWEDLYRKQCSKHHGVIIPPDFKERRPVPLDEIYVPARISITDEDNPKKSEASLYDLIDEIDRDVLVGDPGGGKSTTTHAIAFRLAETPRGVLPFVVVLREYAQHYDNLSIAEYIEKQVRTLYQAEMPSGLLEAYLNAGEALVIFDGLDELLENSRRRAIAERIELFSSAYPMSRIYVTSRKVGYKEAQLDPQVFRVLELEGYSRAEIEQYISKWFSIQPTNTDIDTVALQKSFIRESEAIPDLRSNPLLLALLCIIYRGQGYLPKNRIGIYEECSKLLFETWDKSRGIVFNFTFESYISEALKHLAFWMWNNNDAEEGVTEARLISELTTFFSGRAYDTEEAAHRAASQFVTFCSGRAWVLSEAGMTPDHESLFKFTHRTFMEYFAAIQVNRLKPDPKALARYLLPRVARNEWDTVGQLCVHLIHRSADQGADVLISQMLKSSESRSIVYRENVLDFIARCLSDLPVSPKIIKKVIRASIENVARSLSSAAEKTIQGAPFSAVSWRRLAHLDTNPQVVRDEFGAIVDRLFSSSFRADIELACLISIGIAFSGPHQVTQLKGRSQYNWLPFAQEKLRTNRDVALSFEDLRSYVALEMFILGVFDLEEYLQEVADDNGLPLEFISKPIQILSDDGNHHSTSLSLPLFSVASSLGEGGWNREAGVHERWLEILRKVSQIIAESPGALMTKKYTPSDKSIPWYHLTSDIPFEPNEDWRIEWAASIALIAVHLEASVAVNDVEMKRLGRQLGERSIVNVLALARKNRRELPEMLASNLEAASPMLRSKIEAWAKGQLDFISERAA